MDDDGDALFVDIVRIGAEADDDLGFARGDGGYYAVCADGSDFVVLAGEGHADGSAIRIDRDLSEFTGVELEIVVFNACLRPDFVRRLDLDAGGNRVGCAVGEGDVCSDEGEEPIFGVVATGNDEDTRRGSLFDVQHRMVFVRGSPRDRFDFLAGVFDRPHKYCLQPMSMNRRSSQIGRRSRVLRVIMRSCTH